MCESEQANKSNQTTKLTTTQRYMHLMNLNDDEWTCKTASTVEEVMKLVEASFQHITDMDGLKVFKKRK